MRSYDKFSDYTNPKLRRFRFEIYRNLFLWGFDNIFLGNLHVYVTYIVEGHTLQVLAEEYIPYDENTMPVGTVEKVENTPMDMREPVKIADRIDDAFFASGLGIDNGWALPGWQNQTEVATLRLAAVLEGGGRKMETWTTFPCMQVYSGNYVEQHKGKSGQMYEAQCAICLEAEMFPDAIHYPLFPNTILRPGEQWQHRTVYRFVF